MIWLRSFLLLLVLLPLALPAAFAGELTQDVAAQLRYLLGPAFDTPSRILDGQPVPLTRPLMRFYRERDFAPAWIDDHGISPLAGAVLDVLERVDEDGLRPGDYAVAPLRSQLEGFRDDPAPERAKVTRLAEFDLLLSRAFIDYAVDQTSGRVDPETLAPDWEARPRRIDPARLLQFALQPDRMSRVLVDLPPPHAGYRRLKRALADYRRLARLPWPELADGPVVRPGEHDSRLPAVRRILTLLGDLQPQLLVEEPGFYDSTTAEAVRAFQRRHGLAADGLIGGMTLTALRVPPAVRVRQIMLNLERWRWLPKDLGARHLLVNIAGFELEAVEPGQPALHMEVVVGKDYRQTPVFSARVRYLQFAPSWYVPPTILREDILPKIQQDPQWFTEHPDFEIIPWHARRNGERLDPATIDWSGITAENFPGMLRQLPGVKNPLGRIKFIFPNHYAVYLHDTSSPQLFQQSRRMFSSGCIRVQRPVELAEFLLEGQAAWDGERIREQMAAQETSTVSLEQPVPVHLLYWTAWVDEAGRVQFRSDIYRRDELLRQALSLPAPPPLATARLRAGP